MATLPEPETTTVLGEVAQAVAGGLGAHQGAAVGEALAGQNALVLAGDALVLAVQIADLARAHADVAGRHVHIRADVLEQLRHEALAEAHDLKVALALGVEVAAALAAADGQAGQAVLQRLLEGQELHGILGDGGVQPQAALVGADGAVALHAVAAVHVHVARVVHPRHAELDHALLLHEQLQHAGLYVFRMLFDHGLDGFQNALHGDQELLVVRVARLDARHQVDQISV